MNNMETITIGKYSWQKFVGDEGQDVYVAQFHDDCEHKLGKYMEESDFDILFQSDADFYAPPKQDIFGSSSGELTEDNIIFKFRKNKFTEQEQLGARHPPVRRAQAAVAARLHCAGRHTPAGSLKTEDLPGILAG